MKQLNGIKTYCVAGVGILFAVVQYWNGSIDMNAMIGAIIVALGLSAQQHGVVAEAAKTQAAVADSKNVIVSEIKADS